MERTYQYRPARFFLITFLVTWTPWFMALHLVSRHQPGALSLLNLLGLLGPLVVSVAMILGSGNSALKADFKDRILNWRRIEPKYLAIAIAMPPIAIALSIALSLALGESAEQFRFTGGPNLGATVLLTMVLAPVIEEVGWRGYGVDSLRSRWGMLTASLVFGVLWSLWHAPLVLIHGTYHHELASMDNKLYLANFFVSVIPAAIVANWLYYRNNRSIVAGIVAHAMLNGAAVLIAAGQVAKVIVTVMFAIIAVALIVLDRPTLGAGPRNFVTDPPDGVR